MLLSNYTEFTRTTAIYPKEQALEYLGLGLVSEAGEVAGKLKKRIRDGAMDVDALAAEIGDVYWYLSRLCDEIGIAPGTILRQNMEKLSSRKERGTIGGSGDIR